jgi:hypothetical protein
MSRTRRDSEHGAIGSSGKGKAPHWSIGGNTGTAGVAASKFLVERHRCRDSGVFVTATSTIRSQRVTAHDPHMIGLSSVVTVHALAGLVTDTVASTTVISPTVKEAWCLHGCEWSR